MKVLAPVVANVASKSAFVSCVDGISAMCVAGMLLLVGAEPGKKSNSARILNARVMEITKAKIAESKAKGTPLDREFLAAQRPMTLLKAGMPVYNDDRWMFTPLLLFALCAYWACDLAATYGAAVTVICFLLNFLAYDLYSGILHLCLDHPENIDVPIMGQPCLEFQWHHHIPEDIVVKGLFEACADLNLVGCLLLSIQYFGVSGMGADKLVLGCAGMKAMIAQFGQYSHRASHTRLADRPPFAKWCQNQGLMITVKDHHKHHTAPHDTEFCLIGVCNPIMNRLIKFMPPYENNKFYLGLFAAWSFLDMVLICRVVRTLAPNAI